MTIEKLVLGALDTNCYIVSASEGAKEVVLIDPAAEGARIKAAIGARTVVAILLTHGHFDHTGALNDFPDVPVYLHPEDWVMLKDAKWSVGARFGDSQERSAIPLPVEEGMTLHLAGMDFTVLHTPGHTKGGVTYRCGEELFTGDTLFKHAYGRVDHPGGDMNEELKSLRRLLKSTEDARVHPGHGGDTTIFQERGRA